MKLVTVDVFRERIGEMDVADINVLLGNALDMVYTPIESMLKTRFLYGVHTDFYYPPLVNPAIALIPYTIQLSSGFIHRDKPVEIRCATSYAGLNTAPIDSSLYSIDFEKGLVIFHGRRPNLYIKVTYTSGLPDTQGGDYDLDMLPTWLSDFVIMYAQAAYSRLIGVRAKEDASDDNSVYPLTNLLDKMPIDLPSAVMKYVRWFPTSESPTLTMNGVA